MKILTLAIAASLTGCMVGDGVGNSDEDILGGTVDYGDPSVVQLRYSVASGFGVGTAGCTATVISPRVLLTAAHCANGFNYEYNPATSANPFDPTGAGWIPASFAMANPSYNGNTHAGFDVAVIVLSSTTSIAPSPLGPAPGVGATVRAVGYGFTQPVASGGTGGTKMEKAFPVSSVADREFVAGPNDTCHGDSGGPIFDTSNAIVGTTSYGDSADCNGNDHFMRVDDNRAWIDQQLSLFSY